MNKETIEAWFSAHFSPVSQDEKIYNWLWNAKEDLIARCAVQETPPAPAPAVNVEGNQSCN